MFVQVQHCACLQHYHIYLTVTTCCTTLCKMSLYVPKMKQIPKRMTKVEMIIVEPEHLEHKHKTAVSDNSTVQTMTKTRESWQRQRSEASWVNIWTPSLCKPKRFCCNNRCNRSKLEQQGGCMQACNVLSVLVRNKGSSHLCC